LTELDPRSFKLDFSMYQSGIDFKCPSNSIYLVDELCNNWLVYTV
jgi:hypothetical protein